MTDDSINDKNSQKLKNNDNLKYTSKEQKEQRVAARRSCKRNDDR